MEAAAPETARCMQDAVVGGAVSCRVTDCWALPGEMEAGLQMEETGVLMEVEVLLMPVLLLTELEDDEDPVLDTAGGVNWPLLSEPVLSLAGEAFFFGGRNLVVLPLCCCCRHFARRFLNHT